MLSAVTVTPLEHDYWVEYTCLDCGGPKKSSKGSYCKACGYKHRTRPTGLTYDVVAENPTWFHRGERANPSYQIPKGNEPWNKGTKGLILPNSGSFTSERTSGENNSKWAGDDVGYGALHIWISNHFGSADEQGHCELCGASSRERRLQWANLSYEYTREQSDWAAMCSPCHTRYDMDNGWGRAKELFGGRPYGKRIT